MPYMIEEIDCTTGKSIRRRMTESEAEQEKADREAARAEVRARVLSDKERGAALGRLKAIAESNREISDLLKVLGAI